VIVALAVGIVNLLGLREQQQATTQQEQAAAQQDQESRYSSVSQLSLDLDKTIADHPRFICYFQELADSCKVKPVLTAQETLQAGAIAIYMVDFYQYLYDQLEVLGYVPNDGLFVLRGTPLASMTNENWVTWGETIVGGFENSTLACKALGDSEPAYEWKFVNAVYVVGACRDLPDPGPSPYPYP
jgi:hypothetical protein